MDYIIRFTLSECSIPDEIQEDMLKAVAEAIEWREQALNALAEKMGKTA